MKVILSDRAEKNLEALIEYLIREWSEKVKNDFLKKFYTKVDLVASRPDMCPVSDKRPEVHKCVVTKHTTFYYKVGKGRLEIITLHDNRKDPGKLRL